MELFRAVLVQISAEMAQRLAHIARDQTERWDALRSGIDSFLDGCMAIEMRRIVLVDGPSVLGWDIWRAIDSDYGLGLLEAALQRAIDAGRIPPQSAQALAHVVLGALHEAGMVVAEADDPAVAWRRWARRSTGCSRGLRSPMT